jgi:hypothetical protein
VIGYRSCPEHEVIKAYDAALLNTVLLAALGIVSRPEFARHIRSGFSRESDAGCCSATTGVQSHLRDDARGGMPR